MAAAAYDEEGGDGKRAVYLQEAGLIAS